MLEQFNQKGGEDIAMDCFIAIADNFYEMHSKQNYNKSPVDIFKRTQ